MGKIYISAGRLERDAWDFAIQLHQAGCRFDWVVGVARGGAQISIYMQEVFCLLRRDHVNYAAVQAWSYTAIGEAETDVKIRNMDALADTIQPGQRMLVVDDVFDRGHTMKRVSEAMRTSLAGKAATIELGTLYWKPDNNQTNIEPHFYHRVYAADDWLVFPHELRGLSQPELAAKGFPVGKADIT
ncbi:MAG: phosphoribosyltransferase family protein [Lentisphaeria bacterium]|nr:phosphoribosyltransferase family protein [Lentisphaeria bacterium]